MKADTSHVLMSDVLRGTIPDVDPSEALQAQVEQHVLVVAALAQGKPLLGVLQGIQLGIELELQFRYAIEYALDVIETKNLLITGLELHHGERVVKVPGPFAVKAARIDEVAALDQLCTLSLHLARQAR